MKFTVTPARAGPSRETQRLLAAPGRNRGRTKRRIQEYRYPPEHLKRELSYRQMLRIADFCDGWAQDKRMTPTKTGKLMGWAEGLRALADQVGEERCPPPLNREDLGPIGFLARRLDDLNANDL